MFIQDVTVSFRMFVVVATPVPFSVTVSYIGTKPEHTRLHPFYSVLCHTYNYIILDQFFSLLKTDMVIGIS